MKVRQIIYLDHWYDGSGFGHCETFEDSIINVNSIPEEYDWSWWEKEEHLSRWDDIRITVVYFSEDSSVELGSWAIWESDIK